MHTPPELAGLQLEHIGIAVQNAADSTALFSALLGVAPYKEELVELEQVRTVFFRVGNTKIELLEATSPESAIAKHLEKRGPGLHHLAFGVEDIHAETARMKAAGFTPLRQEPKPGADNKLVIFFHPKTTGHVLIELCMDRPAST